MSRIARRAFVLVPFAIAAAGKYSVLAATLSGAGIRWR